MKIYERKDGNLSININYSRHLNYIIKKKLKNIKHGYIKWFANLFLSEWWYVILDHDKERWKILLNWKKFFNN